MSMNRYAGSGPIMAGLAATSAWAEPFDGTAVLNVPAAPLTEAHPGGPLTAYPGLSNDELTRMIENLADQVSELAAQNVELRARLTKLETTPANFITWNQANFGG